PRLAALELVASVAMAAACLSAPAAASEPEEATASAKLRLLSLPPDDRTAAAGLDACLRAEPRLSCVWTLMLAGGGGLRSLRCHNDGALSCRSDAAHSEPTGSSASCGGCPDCLKLFRDISGDSGADLKVGCLCSCAPAEAGDPPANRTYPCGADPAGACGSGQQLSEEEAPAQSSYLLVGPLAGLAVMAAIGFLVLRRNHICRSTDPPRITGQIEFAFSAEQQQPRQSVGSDRSGGGGGGGRRESCTRCGAVRVEVTGPDSAAEEAAQELMEPAEKLG
ncbi:hypothetical protein BOX15_Mlig006945g2, partial [Macrostomum lignano]